MAIAETARLVSSLELNTAKFDAGVKSSLGSLGKLSGGIAKSRAVAVGLGVGLERIAEKGLSALGGAIADGIQGALTLEKTMAQTQAVVTSTGGAAGVTADQVRDLANSVEDLTTIDDKTVQQAENLLLTFTSIGKDVFPAATKAAANMAIAFNKGDASTADLDGAAIQLGKALNDPAAGFAALKKSGVSFSDAQIKILKGTNALTKEEVHHYLQLKKNDKAGAERYLAGVKQSKLLASQKLILAELDKEFGKAGEAAGTGFAADISRANDAIDDAKISIAQGLIPAVGEVARELKTTLDDPQVKAGLVNLGKGIGEGIKGLVAFAKTLPWGAIASSLQAAGGFAKDLIGAFAGLPTWVQTAVITGWGLNKLTGGAVTGLIGSLASGLIKGVLGINAGVVNINAATVTGGPAGLPGAAAGAAGGLGLGAVILGAGAASVIGGAIALAVSTAVTGIIDPTGLSEAQKGNSLGNRDPRRFDQYGRVIANYTSELPHIAQATRPIPAGLRGIDARLAMQAKTPKQADAILAAGAQRDKETSDAIATIVAQQATSNDIETLRGNIAQGLQTVDTSTIGAGHAASIAATQAGFGVARQTAASGYGIEAAIHSIDVRPVISVEISATNVTRVNVEADRGGERSGSRDGDGGGGPGQ